MTSPEQERAASIAALLAELQRLMGSPLASVPEVTVRDFLSSVRAAATPGTRGTYETYWNRLVAAHGDALVSGVTSSQCAALARTAKATAVTRSNSRGGSSAEENCIGALRAYFRLAVADKLRSDNPASAVAKPSRKSNHRRALTASEQVELWDVTTTGGDDVLLDALLHRFHLETGARRGGALSLRLCDLDDDNQLILLREKGETERWQPVSLTLLAALRHHAATRGATGPREAVLRYKPKQGQTVGAPLTRRRYNTLALRWQKSLPWAARLGISPHWLRHTAITAVDYANEYGPVASAAGAGLALAALGSPSWGCLLGGLLALALVARLLWTGPRLAEARRLRVERQASRRVLDAWPAIAVAARLVTRDDRIPVIERVMPGSAAATGTVLDLHLRLPAGLTTDDVEQAAARLAVALGAVRVEVEADPLAAALVLVSVVLDDPLAQPSAEPSPLLAAGSPWHPRSGVPLGRLSDGSLLAPELLGQHWLIAGMTGTGKSTTGQSVAAFLALCSAGTATAVVLDPKGGAEFAWLADTGVVRHLVGADVQEACEALGWAVEQMHRRQARCAVSGRRATEPGIIDPLLVILIDEAAAYRRDKKHRDEFDRLLTLLAEQGRSSAISLVLLTQTPSVENVPSSIRNNLGVRLIHRCATSGHSEVALGDGTSRQPGWDASRLPYGKTYAGLGLAVCEQTAGRPRRFRSFLLLEADQSNIVIINQRRRGLRSRT